MLVLTRKVGEQITIGDEIVVKVVEINRQSVRLGIEAPRSVRVLRQEVYEKIREENLHAVRAGSFQVLKQAGPWRPGDRE